MSIAMHGPAFDGSGKIVNREVPEADEAAFRAAGYVIGRSADSPDVKHGQSDGNAEAELKAELKAEVKEEAKEAGESESQTKAELTEQAEAKGLTVKSGMTKADISGMLELESNTKVELVEMAEAKGIDPKGMTKAEIINALQGTEG